MDTFNERKAKAREMLVRFLEQFRPPRGVDDDALTSRLNGIADAFARRMPVHGDYEEKIMAVFQRILDTYSGNTWPAQAVFVDLMPKSEMIGKAAPQSYSIDNEVDHYRKKIEQGEALPEPVVWGRIASSIGFDLLRPYRKQSVATWKKTYGADAERMMRRRYGQAVDDFMRNEDFA